MPAIKSTGTEEGDIKAGLISGGAYNTATTPSAPTAPPGDLKVVNPELTTTQTAPATPTPGLSKVGTGAIGPDGKPIYDVFSGQEHIQDSNDPRLKGVNIPNLPTGQSPAGFQSKFEQGFNSAKTSGVQSPTTGGEGASTVQDHVVDEKATNPKVDSFFSNNPFIQQTNDQLMEYISPKATRDSIQTYIDQLAKDRTELSGLRTERMNNSRIISGTEQDLRDEITKAGGFASNSQVQALAIARNKSLVDRNAQIADLIQTQQDAVNTDTTLLSSERQLAQNETTTRMSLLNYQRENTQFMFNAIKDTYKTLMDKNPEGLYASLIADPTQAQRFESVTGITMDALKGFGNTMPGDLADYPQYKKDTVAQGLTPLNATAWLDEKNKKASAQKVSEAYATAKATALGKSSGDRVSGASLKEQQKLEQEYRGILAKEFSSRTGALGVENSKVNQANHLDALFQQYKDSKGNYNIPQAQYAEVALGLANLIAPSGVASDGTREAIMQSTAKGDINKALSYVTGVPQNGSTQAVFKNLIDSIDRQATVAASNRQTALENMKDLAPTDLAPSRVSALNKATEMVKYSGGERIAKQQVNDYVKANIGLKFHNGKDVQTTISQAFKVPGVTNQDVWEYIQSLQ